MKQMEYDVLVVGGGPAGSVSARYAAERGASVLMIEKRQEIGSPVRCGEGISLGWIEDYGITKDSKWLIHEVDGARIISPGGHRLDITREWPATRWVPPSEGISSTRCSLRWPQRRERT